MANVLAVDIGGTKIAVGKVADDGELLESGRIETPKVGDGESLFSELIALIGTIATRDIVAVGVGCGGPMSKGGELVSPLNIPIWRDFPLLSRIRDYLQIPVYVDNDAKALAIGEMMFGGARGLNNFVAMVVSTGIGSGIVLDGRLLDGASGNAGHIGHVEVVPNGRTCVCGAHGCLEAYASGLSIEKITGRPPAQADEILKRCVAELLGRAISSVATLLDVSDFFVSGSVAVGYGHGFLADVERFANAYTAIGFMDRISVGPTEHGARSPLIAAGSYAFYRLGRDGLKG